MFNALSEKSNDEIIIKIAYTFYKDQKAEYISSMSDEIKADADLLKKQLDEFYVFAYLESSIETYLNKAQVFVEDFAKQISDISLEQFNDFLEEKEKEFKARTEGMEKAFNTNFESIIKKNPTSHLRGISQSLMASFIFLLITTSFIFVIWLKDVPIDRIISAITNGTKATEIHQESSENR